MLLFWAASQQASVPAPPELITNGDFSNGTTGWAGVAATLAVVDGACEITATGGTMARASQTITTAIGVSYKAQAMLARGTSGNVNLLISGIATSPAVTTTVMTLAEVTFVATGTSTVVRVGTQATATVGQTCFADDVSVKEDV